MKQDTKKKRGIAKKAISVSLVAAMLATTNVPVWAAGPDIVEEVNEVNVAAAADVTAMTLQVENSAGETVDIEDSATIDWGTKITAGLDDITTSAAAETKYIWTKKDSAGVETVLTGADGTLSKGETYTPVIADIGSTITCTISYQVAADDVREVERSFSIQAVQASSANVTITAIAAQSYTGKEVKPEPTATVKNQFGTEVATGITPGYDYANNINAAEDTDANAPTVALIFDPAATGVEGTVVFPFTIEGTELTTANTVLTLKDGAVSEITYSRNTADYDAQLKSLVEKVVYTASGADPVELTPDQYTLSIDGDNEAALSKDIMLAGAGNFGGTAFDTSADVKVNPRDINTCQFGTIPDVDFTGSAVNPVLTDVIKDTNVAEGDPVYSLISGTDFNAVPKNNIIAGTANVTITGDNNYTGTKEMTFTIKGGTLADLEAAMGTAFTSGFTYTGKAQDPIADAQVYGKFQVYRDFTYTITNNTDPGVATVVVTGVNNYAGQSFTTTFQINPATIVLKDVKVADTVYNKDALTAANPATIYGRPAVTVTFNGKVLTENVDYVASYTYGNIGDAGTGLVNVEVKGIGRFTGTVNATGAIVKKDIADLTIEEIKPQVYTGYAVKPAIVLKDGKTVISAADYDVKYTNNKEVGQAAFTVTMKKTADNYSGTKSGSFQIVKNEINAYIVKSNATGITAEEQKLADEVYSATKAKSKTGITHTAFKVVDAKGNLVDASKYEVSYSNNTAAGTASIIVTGKGSGNAISAANTFVIKPAKLPGSAADIDKVDANVTYTGEPITFDKAVYNQTADDGTALVKGTDYDFEYKNNVDAGAAAIVVVGKGNYSNDAGEISKAFTIDKAKIDTRINVKQDATVPYAGGLPTNAVISIANPVSGKALVEGTDYTITYGAGNRTAIGAGPTVTVTLSTDAQKNYTFTTNGTNQVVTFDTTYQIVAFNFNDAEVTPIKDQTYTGKEITPSFDVYAGKVKLRKDVDYTVEYKDNIEAGTAKAIIAPVKGLQGYTGSKTVEFKILKTEITAPKNVKASSTTANITVSWDAVDGATGYVLYAYDKGDMKTITERYTLTGTKKTLKYNPGTVRTYVVRAFVTVDGKNVYCKAADAIANKVATATKPVKTDIKSVTAGKGIAKVYTTVGKGAIGAAYCVSYDGGETYKIVAKGPKGVVGSTNYTMKGLKKGAAVIKIRGYVKDHSGKTVYGDWSKAVKVTIK